MIEGDMSNSAPTPRKPRLVLMGEFSAGKSTLSNILLNGKPLPVKVTATRLPPVEITYGPPAAWAVDFDGNKHPIELENLEVVVLEETSHIEICMEAEVLKLCDLVDMPGISDPNMPQEIWENVIGPNDHVIWCTHATQAWRQSEAAIWNILRPQSSGTNVLLITQFDKLQNERDKLRVLNRVERETQGLFDGVYPVALLAALKGTGDAKAWQESGAAAFGDRILRILTGKPAKERSSATKATPSEQNADGTASPMQAEAKSIAPRRVASRNSACVTGARPSRAAFAETGGRTH